MKKNKRVIILLSVLILGIGVSLAYFVGKTIFKGSGATTEGRTATINGSTLDISGNIEFSDNDIYPGHQTLSKVTATATGNNELIAYNLTWVGTNNLNTNLKYKVYVSEEEKEISLTCEKKKKVIKGAQQLNEVCTTTGELGEPISEGEIPKTTEEEQTIKITNTEFITAKEEGEKKYYYIIVEYPDNGNQSIDIGEGFNGRVYGEISNTKADINILGYFIKNEETGKYEEAKTMPGEGYKINTEASQCSNGAKASTNYEDNSINIKGLTIDGTSCYLYYDKIPTSEDTLASLGKTAMPGETDGFGTIDTAEHKDTLYTDSDDFGTTYYYRGKVNNNWVKFGKSGTQSGSGNDLYWRIIRINGDGTIRLIYAGEGSAATNDEGYTTSGTDALINKTTNVKYYGSYNHAEYVGFQFKTGSIHGHGTDTDVTKSNVLTVLDTWFKDNLADEFASGNGRIDPDAGFCNDRRNSTANTTAWGNETDNGGTGTTTTYYGAYLRLRPGGNNPSATYKSKPTFKCKDIDNDYFTYTGAAQKTTTDKKQTSGTKSLTYPVGLITADEVTFAGGLYNQNNTSYYLNNQSGYYWTMSPSYFDGGTAWVFSVYSYGAAGVDSTFGIRPVINLKADVTITGNGTIDTPYEIS